MATGLQFELVWFDDDVMLVRARADDGGFVGTADVYVGWNGLSDAADRLKGFPVSPSDERELVLGSFGPKFAGGAIRMRFRCVDGAGHPVVESSIESGDLAAGVVRSAVVVVPVEAASVDSFIQELRQVETQKKGTARLLGRKR